MKAVITLDENKPAKVEIEKGGMHRSIYLNMQELVNYLIHSVKEEDIEEQELVEVVTVSPSLPPNTIKYSKLSDDTDLIFLFHPETKANVTYHKDAFENVPFPNLVFCFGLRNKRLVKKYVVAYKDRFLRDSTKLFQFPYSNVFAGGSMCYHDNSTIEDLVQLQSFPHNWINQEFNDHLYTQGRTNEIDQSLREVFQNSQNQSFNYDMLKPMNINFERWADSLLQQRTIM